MRTDKLSLEAQQWHTYVGIINRFPNWTWDLRPALQVRNHAWHGKPS